MTNTFTPHVGGVARSVGSFAHELRELGHRVLVVAPELEGMPEDEKDVLRIPAIQNFNGSDFSVRLPIPGLIDDAIREFSPFIVHSHHPFLIGDTALRAASMLQVPIVFTHHTMYEQYTHYVPGDSPVYKRFAIQLVSGYCNLCDQVIAPSETVAQILVKRGVETPIAVVPTGVHLENFTGGDRSATRARLGIPEGAFVVGHLGRLAEEKNLRYLADAVTRFLQGRPSAHFLLVGSGPLGDELADTFSIAGLADRFHPAGVLQGRDLADALAAMDLFAFSSHSETQGLVVAEAMAAGRPVVALDASGIREVVRDGANGRLLPAEALPEAFAAALEEVAAAPPLLAQLSEGALRTADDFSMRRCTERLVELYRQILVREPVAPPLAEDLWEGALQRLKIEWDMFVAKAEAAGNALSEDTVQELEGRP